VQDDGSLSSLLLKGFRPGDLATGLGVMLSTLACLPNVASVLLGSGTTASMTARGAYKDWREDCEKIETNQMYFYYETRERLAALDEGSSTTTMVVPRTEPQALEPEMEEGAAQVDEVRSNAEREAQEFMDENEGLLDKGGFTTLQRLVTQGSYIGKDLTEDLTETTNELVAANRSLAGAVKNSSTRPRRIFELERDVERLKPVYERKKQLNEEYGAFLDRAATAYKRKGGEL
jgi:hypothetical protein